MNRRGFLKLTRPLLTLPRSLTQSNEISCDVAIVGAGTGGFALTAQERNREDLNPGNASVSRLAHEFRVSVAVLQSMLMPYIASGQLTLFLEHTPESATVEGDRVSSVIVRDKRRGLKREIVAAFLSMPRSWATYCL